MMKVSSAASGINTEAIINKCNSVINELKTIAINASQSLKAQLQKLSNKLEAVIKSLTIKSTTANTPAESTNPPTGRTSTSAAADTPPFIVNLGLEEYIPVSRRTTTSGAGTVQSNSAYTRPESTDAGLSFTYTRQPAAEPQTNTSTVSASD